jgi:hypothetical protein
MTNWLIACKQWIENAYSNTLGTISDLGVELRWVSADDLTEEVTTDSGGVLALTDPGIGWLFYFLP